KVVSDIEAGTAHFTVRCAQADAAARLEVQIAAPGSSIQSSILEVRNGTATGQIKLSTVELWDPNSPKLYGARLCLLRRDEAIDTVRTYFGIRKIDFETAQESGVPTALRLNGVARYLRGALYQSYFPEGVYTAGSVETLKDDIQWAKKF